MPAVNRMNSDANPSWADVLRSLSALPSQSQDHYLSLEVNEEVWLVIYYIPDYGYLVSGSFIGDADYFTLFDPSLGDEPVRVWCAGDYMTRPREVFVGELLAQKAIKHFFESGLRDNTLNWEKDDSLWYE